MNKPLTKEQIQMLDNAALRSIARSTKATGAYAMELLWAVDELDRRNQARIERRRRADRAEA